MWRILLLIPITLVLHAGVKVQHDGTTLGKPRSFENYGSNKQAEVTLIRLGKRSARRVLLHFKVPGHPYNKKSFVYKETCETTRCDKIFFKQEGGSSVNLIKEDRWYQLLLPNMPKPMALQYNEKLSKKASRTQLYKQYQEQHFRNLSYPQTLPLLQKLMQTLTQICQSKTALHITPKPFNNQKYRNLAGMALPMLQEISTLCKDPLYREVLQDIRNITIKPSETYRDMELTNMQDLTIYLSPDLYNPAITAKHALDRL